MVGSDVGTPLKGAEACSSAIPLTSGGGRGRLCCNIAGLRRAKVPRSGGMCGWEGGASRASTCIRAGSQPHD